MAEAPLSRDILTRTLQLATPREYAEAISNPVVRRVAEQTLPEHPKRLELLAKQWIGTVTDNTGEVEVYLNHCRIRVRSIFDTGGACQTGRCVLSAIWFGG